MWKDMLIIIHLPSNYTTVLLGINHALYFLLQQLASLQEQLDSLIEKWPPGGSHMSSSGIQERRGGEKPSSREKRIFIGSCCVIPLNLWFSYYTAHRLVHSKFVFLSWQNAFVVTVWLNYSTSVVNVVWVFIVLNKLSLASVYCRSTFILLPVRKISYKMYLFFFIYSYIIGTNDQHGRGGFWFKHTWLWQLRAVCSSTANSSYCLTFM